MSRIDYKEHINPVNRYFEWAGSKGKVKYYDKKTEENVFLDLPFRFLLLERRFKITGYNEVAGNGIYSNEIDDLRNQQLRVHLGNETVSGLYQNISDKITRHGGKFANSLYIAYHDEENKLSIGNFLVWGSSLGAWIDFSNTYRSEIWEYAVSVYEHTEETKGTNTYFAPQYKLVEVKPETDEAAKGLTETVIEYINATKTPGQEAAQEIPGEKESAKIDQGMDQADSLYEPRDEEDLPF